MTKPGDVWVVAGAPGAGKSYFAERFVRVLQPAPALVDKDTMYNALVDSVLTESGRSLGERESEWYDTHIKPHTYVGLSEVAREIRANGCSVVITAPYTEALYVRGAWDALVDAVGGERVRLVWIRTDAKTLEFRLRTRGLERDGDKLRMFDAYASTMHLDRKPVAPHVEIDNRLDAPIPLESQLGELIAGTKVS